MDFLDIGTGEREKRTLKVELNDQFLKNKREYQCFSNSCKIIQEEGTHPSLFYEARVTPT